jgi:hypothetical protein
MQIRYLFLGDHVLRINLLQQGTQGLPEDMGFGLQRGSYLLHKKLNLRDFHVFVGQDRKIWDWKDVAREYPTPGVQ